MDTYINGANTSEEESSGQKKRLSSSTSTIELMVYVDAGVQNDATQNGFSVVEYILGIINMVGGSDNLLYSSSFNITSFLLLCRWPVYIEIQLYNIKLI